MPLSSDRRNTPGSVDHGLNGGINGALATPDVATLAPNVVAMQPVPDLIPDLVDTAVARAAIRLSQSTESPSVFNHRSYPVTFCSYRSVHRCWTIAA